MATHDYVIANGTGAAVRSDLNDALAAIVSNNSSSSAPSTTYAYQWWADTNTNTLKIRNSANNAWITLRELDGTMLMEDGSAASPGLSFASDTSTGIFRSSTNKINFATNGVERLELANTTTTFNEGGNDINLRVETSGSANMLFVDGGEDRVGIGTDSPAERLEVQSASNTTIRIDNADDSTAALLFHNTGSTDRQIAVTSGAMTFGGTSTEFARIDDNGRLLVGVATSQNVGFAHNIQIEGTDGGSSGLSLIRNSADTNGPHIDFASTRGAATASNTIVQSGDDLGNLVFRGADGTDKGSIGVQIQAEVDGTPGSNDMPGRLVIKTTADGAASPTERLRINRKGYMYLSTRNAIVDSNEHIIDQNQAAYNVLQLTANSNVYSASGGGAFAIGVGRTANSAYTIAGWYSGNGSDSSFNDREFRFRGDGNAYADGSFSGGGADYAEYFEWSDGNSSEEDRRGISVVLDGDKIREAVDGEEPIGVISANPSVVGDADDERWKNKYLRNDYGSYDLDENGDRQLNPAYDPDLEYIPRENRPEWDTVGLMGKLRIRKGQVTGARWIKMRDVSATVEEWLVR